MKSHEYYFFLLLGLYDQSLKQQSAIGHIPTNFPHLAKQILFARPYLLYISNGEAIDSLQQCSCFKEWPTNFKLLFQALYDLPNFYITMKSAVFKALLVCPVVNQKNSLRVLLQLLYTSNVSTSQTKYMCCQLAHGQLPSQYTQLFFSLSLQCNDFAHLFPLFGIIVFPMKGVHSCIKS